MEYFQRSHGVAPLLAWLQKANDKLYKNFPKKLSIKNLSGLGEQV